MIEEIMNINTGLNIAAAGIALYCILYILHQGYHKPMAKRLFLMMCVSVFLSSIFSIGDLLIAPMATSKDAAYYMLWAIEVGYFITHMMIAPSFALYITSRCGMYKGNERYKLYMFIAPTIGEGVLHFMNMFIYTKDKLHPLYSLVYDDILGHYTYQRGPYIFTIYALAAIYVAIGFVFLIRDAQYLIATKKVWFESFCLIALTGTVIQVFYPAVQVELLSDAFCLLGILATIEQDNELLDPYTGLYNHLVLSQDLENALKTEKNFFILSIAMGHIGDINLSLSEYERRDLARNIANDLRSKCIHEDIYRDGNGNFTIVIYNKSKAYAEKKLEQIVERMNDSWNAGQKKITIPARYTLVQSFEQFDDVAQLPLLYRKPAKYDKYHGNIRKWGEMAFIKKRKKIENIIARALVDNNFELHYQPIIELETGRVEAAEALLRINDPTIGMISPGDFIPIMEENSLLQQVGYWIVEDVARFKTSDPVMNKLDYIEVNLGASQLTDNTLVPSFIKILKEYGQPIDGINLEITESEEIHDSSAIDNTNALIDAGFSLSLDDYGTGYSNLKRLQDIKYRNIKVDRSLLLAAEKNALNADILFETYQMIHTLGAKIIQEGVETEKQRQMVSDFGADYIQGFYYSRPLSETEFIDYMKRANPA